MLEPRILKKPYHARDRVKIGSREDAKTRSLGKTGSEPFAGFAAWRGMKMDRGQGDLLGEMKRRLQRTVEEEVLYSIRWKII